MCVRVCVREGRGGGSVCLYGVGGWVEGLGKGACGCVCGGVASVCVWVGGGGGMVHVCVCVCVCVCVPLLFSVRECSGRAV